jgi:isopentenyl-diphosphate delta-isomerase
MADRKNDHIQMAFKSQTKALENDNRFIYEPMLAAHPKNIEPFRFLGKTLKAPMWASSMTGGTELAGKINENIARACNQFGMGMGLGSCRIILDDDTYFEDFNVRKYIGDYPLFANLGIAQVEELISSGTTDKIKKLVDKLNADGLIIHVNPLQEFFQPEGNLLSLSPIETIEELLLRVDIPLIVKEVGQGMGLRSIKRLLQLPIEALEFGAFGGTNFSLLELKRGNKDVYNLFEPFAYVGQTAEQMVSSINEIIQTSEVRCRQVIISGGIKNFLDGYYLIKKCPVPAIFGQASSILKYAKESFDELCHFVDAQIRGFTLARAYLRINPSYHD